MTKGKQFQFGDSEIKIPPIKGKWITFGILAILALIFLSSSFYQIGPDEEGVILRFGRYVRTTEPGLHGKIPFGVESVKKVKVKYIFKEEFGFRTLKAGVRTIYSSQRFDNESLMLTGDLNVAVVEWIVRYRIKNARDFLFNVRNPEKTLRDISEAVMREVVGDRRVSEVLTVGRTEIAQNVQLQIQKIMDTYKSGIKIVTVKLQDVNPPDPVKPAFNDVNEAKQEKERMINQAWEAYNKAIPQAKGEAEKTIRNAEGYALNRVNRAKGDANNFIQVWRAYSQAKDVTRRRLYLETLQDVLPKIQNKYIIDPEIKGILQTLPLIRGGKK
ncbi:MAG: FtsH protease activity modulator HflK [Calditrichaeota bacterium]|nr:FtsH protease activity modulator HflK [Calditrichota bacterium]